MSKEVKLSLIIGSFLLVGIIIIAVVMTSKKERGNHEALEASLFGTNHYKGGTIGGVIQGYLSTISFGG